MLTLILLSVSSGGLFAAKKTSKNKAPDIKQVKKNIESTTRELAQKQKTQKEIGQKLQLSQESLKKGQSELTTLNAKHKALFDQVKALREQMEALSEEIIQKQVQLSQILFLQNKRPHQDALVVLLKNENPNQKGRDLTYLRYIAQANQKIVKGLKSQQDELLANEEKIDLQLQEISNLMNAKKNVVKQLEGHNTEALKEHNKLTQAIDVETKKLASLRSSEQQLTKLTRQLAKQSLSTKKTKIAVKTNIEKPTKKIGDNQRIKTHPENESIEKNDEPIQVATASGFSQAKGHLRLPTQGRITGRFGSSQADGSKWKGIFITTTGSQGVSSVYSGNVIYIGQVGSFGDTVIVDHGDNYVTVYMGLSSINVGVGSSVKAGQHIGSTGQNDSGEHGLYFQVRYLSQPVNPAAWLG